MSLMGLVFAFAAGVGQIRAGTICHLVGNSAGAAAAGAGVAVALIILQALLITWLLINRARRRRAEEASRANGERYRNVVETQTELICRYLPDSTLTFVNDAYCRYFGKTREQLIETKFTELLPEYSREAVLSHVASLIENPRAETYEHEVVLSNGEIGWQQWVYHVVRLSNGHSTELQGIGRDITEKRRAEDESQLSEKLFRQMADACPVIMWIGDKNAQAEFFNQQLVDFTGRSLEDLLGRGWGEVLHQDDYPMVVEMYTAAAQRAEPFVTEFRVRRADGEFRWLYDTAVPRFGSDGELLGYVGTVVDITYRRAAEEALRIAHEEVSKLKNQLEAENIYLQEEIKLTHNLEEIVGHSDAIKYVLYKIEQVARTDTTVLILGETGTGKELVARAIHSQSKRKERPLVKVNCAALSASLIESELFGHERGLSPGLRCARSGASSWRTGRPSSSTRLASCRWSYSPSCCGSSRRASSSGWGAARPSRPTCASSRRRTATYRRKSRGGGSVKTSGIGSTSSPSRCPRSDSARRTSRCWSNIS
jgi:PAS domain S-box-containing protein